MRVFISEKEKLCSKESLWDGLRVGHLPHKIISIVGAGGKTSIMYGLAEELSSMGKRVVVTTSTRIFRPFDRKVLMGNSVDEISNDIRNEFSSLCKFPKQGGIIVVGKEDQNGKFRGFPENEIGQLAEVADVLLIEADGARRLPLKVPGEHEPVLIPETQIVIGCAGLDSIGMSLEQVCFRYELAVPLLEVQENHKVTSSDLARILTSPLGTEKNIKGKVYRIILNKADNQERLEQAKQVISELEKYGTYRCVITQFDQNKKTLN